MPTFDYVLIGGGLQSGLIAAALAALRPAASVAIVERAARVGGNHTWCFHAADISESASAFVEPFVATRWPGYVVQFPRFERTLEEPYAAVTASSFARRVEALSESSRLELVCGDGAAHVDGDSDPVRVVLASGRILFAKTLIEARGPDAVAGDAAIGFQKFLGLELEVEPGSAPRLPTLMDARVPQRDAFRFFYTLPLAPGRVLVEDTYFADDAALDLERLRAEILAYAASTGLDVRGIAREEVGVLPLPARAPAARPSSARVFRAGYQGGFFHPTTGYSFPLAVRVAATVAETEPSELSYALSELARREARQQRYASLLNRLLFRAFAAEDRRHVLERFYRLPSETVRRFYALTLTPADRARILCGRPPRGFSLSRLLRAPSPALAVPPLPGENA